jgi:catechol 2,3-dioxygenase-like lactoylglutathione lyase family enzyme
VGNLNSAEHLLHHVAVGSADVERLAAFYRDVVGLREIARHHTGEGQVRSIWLDLGGAILMVEHTDKPARRVDGIDTGPFLLAFRVSVAERRELERRLETNGHRIESRSAFTSYSRDADGNRVAFSHYPDPTTPSDREDAS